MTGKSKRRWLPRYSLRTLFVVVTALACWLARESSFIDERKASIARMEEQGAIIEYADVDYLNSQYSSLYGERPAIPFWRRWLGDRPLSQPGVPFQDMNSPSWSEEQDAEVRKVLERLFPECPGYFDKSLERALIRATRELNDKA